MCSSDLSGTAFTEEHDEHGSALATVTDHAAGIAEDVGTMVEVRAGFAFRRDAEAENLMAFGGNKTDDINIGDWCQESFEEIGFVRSEIHPIQKGGVTAVATTGRNFFYRSVFENEPGGNFCSLGAVSGLSPPVL